MQAQPKPLPTRLVARVREGGDLPSITWCCFQIFWYRLDSLKHPLDLLRVSRICSSAFWSSGFELIRGSPAGCVCAVPLRPPAFTRQISTRHE